jgi:membrane-associated phospholipid phosphatase
VGLLRRCKARLADFDTQALREVRDLPRSRVDRALRRLSAAANYNLPWLGMAAVLALRQGRCRRAARRGLVAVAGASALANALAKPLVARSRPNFGVLPRWRRLSVPPTSSAFPSGHSVSAAAFVTAVTVEFPVAGAVVAPLAAAVAYSRVRTGVHWPSDVLGGLVLGSGIALVTRRW